MDPVIQAKNTLTTYWDRLSQKLEPDPVEIYSEKLEIKNKDGIRDWLIEHPQWLHTEENSWKYVDTEAQTTVTMQFNLTDKNTVWIRKLTTGNGTYVFYGFLLLAILVTLSPSLLFGIAVLGAGIAIYSGSKPEFTDAPADKIGGRTNLLVLGIIFGGVLSLIRILAQNIPPGVRGVFLSIICLSIITTIYSLNAFPFQSDQLHTKVLQIPVSLLIAGLSSLSLIAMSGSASLILQSRFEDWIAFIQNNPRGAASILSDLTGGTYDNSRVILTALENGQLLLPIFLFVIVFGLALYINAKILTANSSLYTELRSIKIKNPLTRRQKRMTLSLYFLTIVPALGCYVLAIGFIWYGITGSWPLFSLTIEALSPVFPLEGALKIERIVESIYQGLLLDQETYGFSVTRPMIAGLSMGIFAPIVFLTLGGAIRLATVGLRVIGQERTFDPFAGVVEAFTPPQLDENPQRYSRGLTLLPGGDNLLMVLNTGPTQKSSVGENQNSVTPGFLLRIMALYYGRSWIKNSN